MKKPKNSIKRTRAGTCAERGSPTSCGQPVNIKRASGYSPSFPELFAGIDPVVHRVVEAHLKCPEPTAVALLDAWEKIGRRDARARTRPYFSHTLARTMTPLGVACLVRYARGFEDETQALAAEVPA